jgi:cytochrome c oxidase subunit 2
MNFEVRSVSLQDFNSYIQARESGLSTSAALEKIGQPGSATTTRPLTLPQTAALSGQNGG